MLLSASSRLHLPRPSIWQRRGDALGKSCDGTQLVESQPRSAPGLLSGAASVSAGTGRRGRISADSSLQRPHPLPDAFEEDLLDEDASCTCPEWLGAPPGGFQQRPCLVGRGRHCLRYPPAAQRFSESKKAMVFASPWACCSHLLHRSSLYGLWFRHQLVRRHRWLQRAQGAWTSMRT